MKGFLYLISIAGNVNTFLGLIIAGLLIAALIIFRIDQQIAEEKKPIFVSPKRRKTVRMLIVLGALDALIMAFIPSKKDLLTIYGLDATFEYIKSNETVKALPDKAVLVIDQWLDSYIESDSTKVNK